MRFFRTYTTMMKFSKRSYENFSPADYIFCSALLSYNGLKGMFPLWTFDCYTKELYLLLFFLAVLVFERYLRDWVALYSLPTMPFSVCKIISIWSLFVFVLSISQKDKILLLWKNISCDEFKFLPKLKRLFISDKMMRMRVISDENARY